MSPQATQQRPHALKRFRFNLEFRPRFADLDPMGRVSNARFFTYFEEARMAYLSHLGLFVPAGSGRCLLVQRDTCRYQMPVQHHHLVRVFLRSADWGRRSFSFHYVLWLPEEDVLAAEGTTRVACFNAATGRACDLPEEYIQAMRAFEDEADS
ncbi:MAG: acyl-CoA thioesterase [Proteobacteria bacterium]|nr:acyl-CoA thioesterase [Pseudomonadota bacterium]MBU1450653.1 acyl-CoA thioesterase [Pseudomonadota bacterium]MBU2467110.1 acyl-CoA thioesterase [Pseudomonadota bacterium]MBU2518734.1 acyl-CoA thioesterase [Pseudomonadota bacterium]